MKVIKPTRKMKQYRSHLFVLLFLISRNPVFSQDSNMSFGFTIRYSETPRYAQDFRFINPKKEILPEVLAIFGEPYVKDGDWYEWKNVIVKGLSRRPLQIKVKHKRFELEEPLQGVVVDETFSVIILRKNKDFLHEIKCWNVQRLRKMFKPFEEPLVYE